MLTRQRPAGRDQDSRRDPAANTLPPMLLRFAYAALIGWLLGLEARLNQSWLIKWLATRNSNKNQ